MDALLHALATPRRRQILRLVRGSERAAGDIHRAIGGVTFGAVSQHLRVLEMAGLVRARREGRRRLYQARPEALEPLRQWLESMWDEALAALKAHAEAEQARGGKSRERPRRRGGHERGRRER